MKALYLFILLILCTCWCRAQVHVSYRVRSESVRDTLHYERRTYEYDSAGRLTLESIIRYQKNSDLPQDTTHIDSIGYVYRADSIFERQYHYSFFKYKVNGAGLAISDNDDQTYTYDSAGFLIKRVTQYATWIRNIQNGDVMGETYVSGSHRKYRPAPRDAYYTDIDTRDFGRSPEGRRNTHLVKTWEGSFVAGGKHGSFKEKLSYEFDNFHRVIKETSDSMWGRQVREYTYF